MKLINCRSRLPECASLSSPASRPNNQQPTNQTERMKNPQSTSQTLPCPAIHLPLAGRLWRVLALCLLLSGLLAPNFYHAQAQTPDPIPGLDPQPPGPNLSANKSDYEPGSTALLTGSGFPPFETVTVQVAHADGTPDTGDDHLPWSVVMDEFGEFQTTWHVCEDDCRGSMLEATAIGNSSGLVAKVRFTDAIVTKVSITPASVTSVGNCIPFGQNTSYGFQGFIYRNVPAFSCVAGDRIRFDLGGLNDVDIRRNIYVSAANINPVAGGASQGVSAMSWVKIVSESQTPSSPRGNTIKGDYELTYVLEAPFSFSGGGLIIGFQGNPPATYVDGGCEQVLVYTFSSDASGNFHQRFYSQPNLSMAALDISDSDTGYLGGFIIDSVNNPPVARCQNVTVSAGANCTAPASIDNSSSDPDGDPITLTQTPAGPYSLGTTTVTLTVTDNHGASSTCTATVTVVDTTPPVITGCPANIIDRKST